MTETAETSFRWAWTLLDGLAAAGVRRAVLSPGARSTPLALAALRHRGLACEVVVDERSAAFLALGMAKAEMRPVILVATSGSAVANWLPAVVEADMARVPLILLSADRPPELHDCGANQTMDQLGLFGAHVRAFHSLPPAEVGGGWLAALAGRAVAVSLGPLPGPVHVNVPLREPLVPAGPIAGPVDGPVPPIRLAGRPVADPAARRVVDEVVSAGRGAIVCGADPQGHGLQAEAAALARRLRVPLFADILSGVRFFPAAGPEVLAHPDAVARAAPAAGWVLRLGGTPVSRSIGDWLERCRGRPQVVVAAHPRLADPSATATHVLTADPEDLCRSLEGRAAAPEWLDGFLALDGRAAGAAEAACADSVPFEGALLRAVVRALPQRTPLFLGNSLAVRGADWFAGRVPSALRPFGNRGVSGIDGNLSTAFGIAGALGPAVAVVGDLAFLHDLNALALGRGRPLAVLLLDNHGGGIFDHLPQAALPEFEQAWSAPQSLDHGAVVDAFGLSFVRAHDVGEAVDAVLAALDRPGATVVHVPIDRRLSLVRCRGFFSVCQQGE